MDNHIRSPQPLSKNSAKDWQIWKQEFLIFMTLLGHMAKSEFYKANLFKNLVGSVGIEIINKLSFDRPADRDNLDILLKKIDEYFNPPRKEVEKRYQFFNSSMNPNETIESYIKSLKDKAKNCKFGDLEDSLVIDVIILHANDKVLRKKYLQEDNLTCEKVIEIYKNHKISILESNSASATVPSKQKSKSNVNVNVKEKEKEKDNSNVQQRKKVCSKCNTSHEYKQCPAWNHKCTTCGEMHHFERCCKNLSNQNKTLNKSMNNLTVNKNKGKSVNEAKQLNNLSKQF
ncbi:PREDICTED: uncharacterized protein LOC107065962 [Polistes dominula]|uniref:Uncharacterized protein LOC107065962 n=1 Tax=Polistes dominula TaxID=743375 RepID=A0ABM1I5V6_POLDO|nr:PREDICTED: uncharacterized protein LOC107065962 [Polistes dominula]